MEWRHYLVLMALCSVVCKASLSSRHQATSCNTHICYSCGEKTAKCVTTADTDVVPQDLSPDMESFQVTTRSTLGESLNLTRAMLQKYRKIKRLTISGGFSGVDSDALEPLVELSHLIIQYTRIERLPKDLFVKNLALGKLELIGNALKELPSEAFLSLKRPNLATLIVQENRNPIHLPCHNGSLVLPEAFAKFALLKTIDFSHTQFIGTGCSRIGSALFKQTPQVTELSVSGTNLFGSDYNILEPLRQLRSLSLNNLEPFKSCPALIGNVLAKLPNRIKHLHMEHWNAAATHSNGSCHIDSTTFAHLGKLPLVTLSLKHSSSVFTSTLLPGVIPPLPYLQTLNLGFCKLTFVDSMVWSSFPALQTLVLNGNPFVSDHFPTIVPPLQQLKTLRLQNVAMRSVRNAVFDASGIIRSFPSLSCLDLSENLLEETPQFCRTNCTLHPPLEWLDMSKNGLKAIFLQDGTREGRGTDAAKNQSLCLLFPGLKRLEVNSNKLEGLEGLQKCSQLEWLSLRDNNLNFGANTKANSVQSVIMRLNRLKNLDLSKNYLRFIKADLLKPLPRLTMLDLSTNNIDTLASDFFKHNKNLKQIDLNWNFLRSFPAGMISGLNLTRLKLAGNQITTFDSEFQTLVDNDMPFLARLYIGNNPYYCDCDGELQDWIRHSKNIYVNEKEFLYCSTPEWLKNQSIYTYENDAWRCSFISITIALSLLGGFILTLAVALPCYKFRWYIKNIRIVSRAVVESLKSTKQEETAEYDAYVSYDLENEDDENWIVSQLVPRVEVDQLSQKHRLYLERRDALPGSSRFSEREKAVANSRRILIVVSNSYLKSSSCLGEADLVGCQMYGDRVYSPNRIMVLIREELTEEIIRPPMSSLLLGRVVEVDAQAERKSDIWKVIRAFLDKRTYVYKK